MMSQPYVFSPSRVILLSLIALDPRVWWPSSALLRRQQYGSTQFRQGAGLNQSVDNYKQIFQRMGSYDRTMNQPLRSFLADLYRIAVAAAHPASCLPALLPPPPSGRLILIAAGKAAGSMTEVAEAHYLGQLLHVAAERLSGVAVARHGYGRSLRRV